MGHKMRLLNHVHHIAQGNTKFVLSKSCGDVGVGMCAYIGVDAKTNICLRVHLRSKLLDNFKFGQALNIKAKYAFLQAQTNFPIALADSRINNLVCRKARFTCCLYFTAAYTVCS